MKTIILGHLSRFSVGFAMVVMNTFVLSGHVNAASSIQPNEKSIEFADHKKSSQVQNTFTLETSETADQHYHRYVISLTDKSVAHYQGDVNGYNATTTAGKTKLDANDSRVDAYKDYLLSKQAELLNEIAQHLGRAVTPVSQLQFAKNALVVDLTNAEALIVRRLSGVISVHRDQALKVNSTNTYDGYAAVSVPGSQGLSLNTVFIILLISILVGLLFAYQRGWLKGYRAIAAVLASSLGLAGCFYEEFSGGFAWIGAPEIWRGAPDLPHTMGEGIVVGIIDSGINPISDSFAEVADDGYRHQNPREKFFGVCDPSSAVYDKTFPCNNKLIGAWGSPGLDDETPYDYDGHGSHVAGTAAGNLVYNATLETPTGYSLTKTIAGVAPRANIISYKACGNGKVSCSGSDILAAVDQAIKDGVDVINFSVGFDYWNPWESDISQAFLALMDAGIFVAVSAGNNGPHAATLTTPSDAPWVTAVAASSHNLFYGNALTDLSNDQGDTLPDIMGQSLTSGYGPAALVDAADYGNPLCKIDEFTQPFNGEIVLCDAGEILRVEKGDAVKANGGGGFILARPPKTKEGSGYLEADAHHIPATHITYENMTKLREWLANGSGHQARISGTQPFLADETADVLGYFSSRGPGKQAADIIKPNIAGPGRAVFAAYHANSSEAEQDYHLSEGTSMASPHITGAAALLKSLHSDWTPMQIQSAIMTTANPYLWKEDDVTAADPFDVGAGGINLPLAARAALVLDETAENFQAANPATGGDPSKLNLASLGDGSCLVDCRWSRTLTNSADQRTYWYSNGTDAITVEPAFFSLAPGESIDLIFTANTSKVTVGEWLFDQLTLNSLSPMIPNAHFPIAALAIGSSLPESIDIKATQENDVVTLENIKAVEITDTTVTTAGLVPSTVHHGALVSDPTNNEPYDGGFDPNKDGQQMFLLDIPEGATRLVAEITASESADLDLFVGKGEKPSRDTWLQGSTTFTAIEYISLLSPPAGKLWVVVQNWEPGHETPQAFTLHVAIVGGDNNNLTVNVPSTNQTGGVFDVNLGFHLPGSITGDRYYGSFSLGTDKEHEGNLGQVLIDLVRE